MIINHEVGHTLGLADHYFDSAKHGHVDDTAVYTGVMDNDMAHTQGYVESYEALGAYWSAVEWYWTTQTPRPPTDWRHIPPLPRALLH